MKKHQVVPGDCLESIAEKYGFFPKTLWKHSANAKLRRLRKDMNLLLPDDAVQIPELRRKTLDVATGKRHVFTRKGVPSALKIVLLDEDGEAIANAPYVLTLAGQKKSGKTGADGMISVPMPPQTTQGKLVVHPDTDAEEQYDLSIGGLDPIDELTGVQARLRNLGYDCGQIDGELGQRTARMLERFQNEQGLEPTGQLDDATKAALKKAYGC